MAKIRWLRTWPRKVAWFLCAMPALMTHGIAQDFPTRPVKIITQGAAGSGPDVVGSGGIRSAWALVESAARDRQRAWGRREHGRAPGGRGVA
jgi:hypothetical protein